MLNSNYLELVKAQLTQLANQANFESVLTTAFGTKIDRSKIFKLRQQWLNGDFSLIPPIDILSHGELGNANGGYAASEDRIFVSSDFLTANQNNPAAITNLLLEEFGHKLDQFFNGNIDSAGDEGEIFAALAQGKTLSDRALTQLRAEDDHRTISVDGKLVAIEMETWNGTSGSDIHYGMDPSNTLRGFDGNDFLYGGAGDDILEGGAGNDSLDGGAGDDILEGGAGDDILEGGAGDDYLDGDSGNDYFEGGVGDDEIDGGDGADTLYGDAGSDTLYGGSSRDTLDGGAGEDTLYGGDSGDKLFGGTGADIMLGGTGNDIYFVDNVGDIVSENIYEGTDTVNSSITYTLGAYVENLSLTEIGNINGTGNALNNIIKGNIGNNTLSGGAGKDTINGGDGNDIIYGGDGDDTVDGGDGKDTIYLGAGNDTLSIYSLGDDIFYGGTGDDIIFGNTGNETYYGEAGNDLLLGGVGNDTLIGGVGNDALDGEFDNDTYVIDADVDLGTDTIYESGGTDTIDFRTTTTKAITINLNLTTLQTVATGVQLIIPVVSIENVYGGSLNDTLIGNNLNDYLLGGAGNDILSGGNGSDYLVGGVGNDTLTGGIGSDIYVIDADVDLGTDTINEIVLNAGSDTIDFRTTTTKAINLNLNTTTLQTVATGVQLVIPVVSIENLYGGSFNDTLAGNSLNNQLLGSAGNDTLTGGGGNDNFYYGGGAITGSVTVASLLGKDTISDFSKIVGNQDKIVLSKGTFTQITSAVGGLTAADFASFTTDALALASTSSAAILYSSGTGNVFYNQDGIVAGVGANGGIFATLLAPPLGTPPALAVTDFNVVA